MSLKAILGSRPIYILCILVLQLWGSPLRANVVANFTPSIKAGCSPLVVSFTNTSTGTSASAIYIWNFGNGNGITTTNKNNPVAATYITGQDYTVTLTVKDGKQTSTKTATITVYKNPVINFTSDQVQGCAPLLVRFTDSDSVSSSVDVGYFWDFGDGNTFNGKSDTASNTYHFSGSYSVSLTVTNSHGCTNTKKLTNMIKVDSPLVPNFTADTTSICSLSQPISFLNTSTGFGTLKYNWNFGDGTTSTLTNPVHRYTQKGTYPISLVVSNNLGCSSTLKKPDYINAVNYHAAIFTTTALCSGTNIQFVDSSSPAPTTNPLWSFGDGSTGLGTVYSHRYTSAGNYKVTLYQNLGSCPDTVTQNIIVTSPPVISPFTIDKGANCESPMLVSFRDTSSASVAWHWNFTSNPGDTSNLQSPSFLYSKMGLYSPMLTISNTAGCTSSIIKKLNSAKPSATIKVDTTLTPSALYCANVQAKFTAISLDSIASYQWTFGDGTSSTSPNPIHIYSTPGTYIINLSFTTTHGCIGQASPPDTIIVYPKPHAVFTAKDSMLCVSNQTEVFTNLNDSAAKITWFYGDNKSDINNLVYHTHHYPYGGNYVMTLIASSPGCKSDTSSISQFITTTPIPTLTVTNNCDSNPLSATLTVTPSGASQYIWVYGDGSPNDTNYVYVPTRKHLYPSGGKYSAMVMAQFGNCLQNTGLVPVYIMPKQHPLLSSTKDTICASASLPVFINGLGKNEQALANGSSNFYTIVGWQYRDGTIFSPNGNNGFALSYSGNLSNIREGKDSIRVIIQSTYFSCYDTSNYIPIYVTGPTALFDAANSLCYRSPIIFTDSSKPADGVAIVQWQWNFGDGHSLTNTNNNTVQHLYANPGDYNPILKVTDSNGCFASAALPSSTVFVYGAKAAFTWSPSIINPGAPIEFYNNSINNTGTSYGWHFSSDGSSSNSADSLSHIFPNIDKDTVTLIAYPTMPGVCTDTVVQVLAIQKMIVAFTYTTQYIDHANCPPLLVNFVSNTLNTTKLHWDFGDLGTANDIANPNHTYLFPGTYMVTLTGYNANGIHSSYQQRIVVKGPTGTLSSSLKQACVPAVDTLHTTASYADSYTWDFGDGTVISTKDTLAIHTYISSGLFTPSMILKDSTGCQVTYKYGQPLLMDSLHISFESPSVDCDLGSGSVTFSPHFMSFVADSLGYPLTYHWNFGQGSATDSSNIAYPSFHFSGPGNYIGGLRVQSPIGCQATAFDTLHITGPFKMNLSKDMTICTGSMAVLNASGAATYNWSPSESLNSTEGDNVDAYPFVSTTYTVVGEDQNHCFKDTGMIVVTVDSLPTVAVPPSLSTLPGSDIQIDTKSSADVVSWSWSPATYLNCMDCASPISTPLVPTSYTVTVATANGCSSSATVTIGLICSDSKVHMPNAFTPNGDGNNDFFYPVGEGIKLVKHFQIFSRWGQLLFSKSDFPANEFRYGWNGTLNYAPLPVETYVYVMEFTCFTGESIVLKGTVELIR
ncbi:MAG: PKD domain-containing protein [Bacteroidetes bacterium]|nr:PKD domain-containing protein [Bacteroidota bacterium]